jgi:hypothetical protein
MRRPTGTISRSFTATTSSTRPAAAPQRALTAQVARSLSMPGPAHAPAVRPLPPLPPSKAPAAEYRQHHEVEAPQVDTTRFRQGWRVSTRLDGLLEASAIDREAWEAAGQWRRLAEPTAPMRSQPWDARVDHSLTANDAAALHRVRAGAALRACAEALGELRIRLLELHVIRDVSWRELVPPVIDSAVDFRIDGSAMTEMHRDRETDCREEVCGEPQR